jgi:hypothetical protein
VSLSAAFMISICSLTLQLIENQQRLKDMPEVTHDFLSLIPMHLNGNRKYDRKGHST